MTDPTPQPQPQPDDGGEDRDIVDHDTDVVDPDEFPDADDEQLDNND